MPRLFRFGVWLILAGWGCSSGRARETWVYSQSEHFELLSCAPEWEARKALAELEQFRISFLTTVHLPPARDPRATVVLFENDDQFGRVKPLRKGQPTDAAGYFLGREDEVAIALVTDLDRKVTREIIFHEYVHLLMHSHDLRVAAWLNEGLAELFSTFEISDGIVRFGRPKTARLAVLTHNKRMHLGELFAFKNDSHNDDVLETHIFYAESWALVHFWLCGEDQSYRPKLVRFMTLLSQKKDVPVERSFQEAFGIGYEEMERRFEKYLESGSSLSAGPRCPSQTTIKN